MHYGNGITKCRDVLASEFEFCSDLNTTLFLKRVIQDETPDFIAFTGNLFVFGLFLFLFPFLWIFCFGVDGAECSGFIAFSCDLLK